MWWNAVRDSALNLLRIIETLFEPHELGSCVGGISSAKRGSYRPKADIQLLFENPSGAKDRLEDSNKLS
jgi:hypothetical protein